MLIDTPTLKEITTSKVIFVFCTFNPFKNAVSFDTKRSFILNLFLNITKYKIIEKIKTTKESKKNQPYLSSQE